jgi:hypothetical protein
MKKILQISIIIAIIFAFIGTPSIAQEVQYYYSDKMIKNGTFTWLVNQSVDFYEPNVVEGANFTVKLKDSLYPGPLTEEELNRIYASIEIDGKKYTGEGFPLFWHVRKINGSTETTIRDDFESLPDKFNVTDAGSNFYVNFTVTAEQDSVFVEMEIDPTDGITKRYYLYFTDNTNSTSILELVFLSYLVEAPINFLWAILGLFVPTTAIIIRKRKRI